MGDFSMIVKTDGSFAVLTIFPQGLLQTSGFIFNFILKDRNNRKCILNEIIEINENNILQCVQLVLLYKNFE